MLEERIGLIRGMLFQRAVELRPTSRIIIKKVRADDELHLAQRVLAR